MTVESLSDLLSESELSIFADKSQDRVHEKTKPAQVTDFAGACPDLDTNVGFGE